MQFARWYLTRDGRDAGPLSAAQLLAMLSTGEVGPAEWVWPEGVDVRITVQQFVDKVRAVTLPDGMGDVPSRPSTTQHQQLPDWMSQFSQAEDGKPAPAKTTPLDWLDDVRQSELARVKARRAAPALPDWLADVGRGDAGLVSASAKTPPPEPAGPVPDWLNDIREIEESLRQKLLKALAKTAPVPSAPSAGGDVAKPVAAHSPARQTAKVRASPTARMAVAQESAVSWPLSHDYNEAIQNPAQCFADPELRQGTVVTNVLGLPVPCSGSFADVYALQTSSGKLAVKCFTHRIPGLQERYVEISKHLKEVRVPFMVDFEFLEQGIRVRDHWYPVVKMQWAEGLPLNTYVRDQLGSPETLQTLCRMWVRLASRLRKATLAHGDLQHGNVLLMPGARSGTFRVRLVDYDGMCVPALDLLKPIEAGHPAYQHPQRRRDGRYGLEIDRFSHLVIYTAMRCLTVGGRTLWGKYDSGDNLLFEQKDFESPERSALFQELRQLSDPGLKGLIEALAMSCQEPLEQTPLLEDVVSAALGKASAGPDESSYTILTAPASGEQE